MADDRDQQGDSSDRTTALSTRLSEALTSVGIAVRRREAEIELLDKTLAATGESTSAAARMAREKLARTRTEHAEELEIVMRAQKALEDATDDCGAVTDELGATLTQVMDMGAQLQAAEQSVRELGQQLEEAKSAAETRIGDLESKLADSQQALTERVGELSELESTLGQTTLTLADAEGARDAANESLKQTAATLEETKRTLAAAQQSLATTQESLAEKTHEAEELAALMGIMPEGDGAAEPAAAPEPAAEPEPEPEPEQPVIEAAPPAEPAPAVVEAVPHAEPQPGIGDQMAPPGADWGAAVDGAASAPEPPTEAPTEVPPATATDSGQSAVDAQLQAYLSDSGNGEPAGATPSHMFRATRAIEEFKCTDPEEIKLAGALQLQAWQLPELAQLCGLDEGAVLQKLEEYIAAGLVERTQL